MRRLFVLATLLLAVLLSYQPSSAARPLIASGNPEAPPIVWDKTGKLVGVGPAAARRILEKLQVPFIIQPGGTWQQVQEGSKNGSIDLIVSAYDNKERRQYMDFSVPYLKSPVVIVVRKGECFACSAWNGLVGKKGAANTGESFGQEFDTYIHEKLDVTYVPYQRAFEMLSDGTVDYLVMDLYPAIIYSKLLNAEDKIEYLDTPATVQYFHMTISKKSPYLSLMPKINNEIEKMKKEGLFKEMVKEQYKNWNKTFKQRQRFFARSRAKAQQAQSNWDSGARDRGLDEMARFIERDVPYMSGSNTME